MNNTSDNMNSSPGSDLDNSGSELENNQENGESENASNHFYLLLGDQNNDLGEVIRHWESIRYEK